MNLQHCRSGPKNVRPGLDFNGNHLTVMVSLKVSLKIIFEKSDVKKACRITKLAKIKKWHYKNIFI